MSDRRRDLLAWLAFAGEMGIESLPTPRLSLPRRTASRGRPPLVAPAAPAAVASVPASGGGTPSSPIDRLRQRLAEGGGSRTRPPAAAPAPVRPSSLAPAPAASPAKLLGAEPPVTSAPAALARMGPLPAGMLAIAEELFAAEKGPAEIRTLEDVRTELGDCRRCKLCHGRTKIVFGSGSPQAELVFVGEGPGREEDLQGLPFVGRAGQLLTDIIKAIGMTRDEVYICNVVKCRPPENRTPEPDEVEACRGFLFRQLDVIRPKVIVALGKPASETLLRRPVPISEVRGQVLDFFGARLVPTFHPAYLLRNPAKKREVWEDMKKVRDLLRGGA